MSPPGHRKAADVLIRGGGGRSLPALSLRGQVSRRSVRTELCCGVATGRSFRRASHQCGHRMRCAIRIGTARALAGNSRGRFFAAGSWACVRCHYATIGLHPPPASCHLTRQFGVGVLGASAYVGERVRQRRSGAQTWVVFVRPCTAASFWGRRWLWVAHRAVLTRLHRGRNSAQHCKRHTWGLRCHQQGCVKGGAQYWQPWD